MPFALPRFASLIGFVAFDFLPCSVLCPSTAPTFEAFHIADIMPVNVAMALYVANFAGADIVAAVTTHAGTVFHSLASIRAPQLPQKLSLLCSFIAPQQEQYVSHDL